MPNIPEHYREIEILDALANNGNDYNLAFKSIPYLNRSLYYYIFRLFHSLQSYFYNQLLSYRLTNFKRELLEGDLIINKSIIIIYIRK